ncbi:MAG TPA: YdcF family protein [Alphaproteobacteria bacterium]|nr:YdcF family protein [Alphaproteobacteria bacterium]
MKFFNPSLLILCLFVLGGAIFKSTAPTRCSVILPNDNIFVLTGDFRRIPFAMRQMRKHPTAQVYVIGAGASGINMPSTVVIESKSRSTYQNAMAIKRIVEQRGLDRIVLITTVDHFNRAKYLIRNELPDIDIAPCPVSLTGMPASKRLERWTTEYVKYIGTLIGVKDSK